MLSISRSQTPPHLSIRPFVVQKSFMHLKNYFEPPYKVKKGEIPNPISHVYVYKGHEKNPLLGPFHENIGKRIRMFQYLNMFREGIGLYPWEVTTVAGERLIDTLNEVNPKTSLLVIPAGQSTRLDKVFSLAEKAYIKEGFVALGGRCYVNCGSAYWFSKNRVYHDLCEEHPEERQTIRKESTYPLFQGTAEGPLCPFPGKKYKVGFFSDAVSVTDGLSKCTILLSGGGSFIFPKEGIDPEQTTVIVRYFHDELIRLGIAAEDCTKYENAALLVKEGQGAALLSMFHPYYNSEDIDVEEYEKAFPGYANWEEVHRRLSPIDIRMRFAFNMVHKLEAMDFTPMNKPRGIIKSPV